VPGDELRIGRGVRAALRSENPAVSLDHATISRNDAGYTLTDLGSITGTYVNGRPVESARLAKGDVIEIGDLRLEVQAAEANKPLFLRVVKAVVQVSDSDDDDAPQTEVAKAGIATLKAPKIDYAGAFRLRRVWFTKLSLTALLCIATIAIVGEVTKPSKQTVFAPGGVSSAHARARNALGQPIANDCRACHDPFKGVTNEKCQVCHGPMLHAVNQALPPPCTACHDEHRSQGRLAMIPDRLCVDCHGNLAVHVKNATKPIVNVTSFGTDHPEFTYPNDIDTLRLNHKLHLQPGGIFNAQGKREVLQCASCHHLANVRGKMDPAPIDFKRDCQRCHRLTFDPRFPDAEVPHGGDPGLVYGFIIQTYAGNRDIAGKSPEELRRILTQQRSTGADERALLDAEQVIKVKCSLCHVVTRQNNRLAATPPVIPTRWLTNAKFSHGPHRNVACEDCHGAARTSTKTSDVLLPSRKMCLDCHAERTQAILASSTKRTNNCALCHEYHVRSNSNLPKVLRGGPATLADVGGGSGMFQEILLAGAVVLLLVLLIPVGIAMYQRMKPAPPERGGARPAAPPPPAPPSANQPTGRMPALPQQQAAPPQPMAYTPPPAQPQQTTSDATRMVTADELHGGGTPGATEAVVWFGMLRCTAGPLEGKTFIVEEDGVYIGRDPSLAQIVIDDSRVSKRHLRVMPRNGKVWALDQSSTNGTFLSKDSKLERITEHQLKRGDTLVLADGAATFVYQI